MNILKIIQILGNCGNDAPYNSYKWLNNHLFRFGSRYLISRTFNMDKRRRIHLIGNVIHRFVGGFAVFEYCDICIITGMWL